LYFLKLKITTTINNKLKTNYNIIFITNINIPYKYLNHITKTPNKMKLEKEGEEKTILNQWSRMFVQEGKNITLHVFAPISSHFFLSTRSSEQTIIPQLVLGLSPKWLVMAGWAELWCAYSQNTIALPHIIGCSHRHTLNSIPIMSTSCSKHNLRS